MRIHYLYRHIRLDKNVPFYIGIGTVNNIDSHSNAKHTVRYRRAYCVHKRSDLWRRIADIGGYEVEILMESYDNDYIKRKEVEFIGLYRRINDGGTLCNHTLGGDGAVGIFVSLETRQKQSLAKKGDKNPNRIHPFSEARKKFMSDKFKGRVVSKQWRENMKKGNIEKGRTLKLKCDGMFFNSPTEAGLYFFPNSLPHTLRTNIARAAKSGKPYKGKMFIEF